MFPIPSVKIETYYLVSSPHLLLFLCCCLVSFNNMVIGTSLLEDVYGTKYALFMATVTYPLQYIPPQKPSHQLTCKYLKHVSLK